MVKDNIMTIKNKKMTVHMRRSDYKWTTRITVASQEWLNFRQTKSDIDEIRNLAGAG